MSEGKILPDIKSLFEINMAEIDQLPNALNGLAVWGYFFMDKTNKKLTFCTNWKFDWCKNKENVNWTNFSG